MFDSSNIFSVYKIQSYFQEMNKLANLVLGFIAQGVYTYEQ